MTEALIIDVVRTPRGIGKVGKGALADHHPQHLGATVLKALAERNNLNTADVDDIIWGTSSQRGKQGGDLGRMSALDAGYDVRASGVTLDRFCGSGITAVNLAADNIQFSIRFGTTCLIGQYGNTGYVSEVTKALGTSRCLVGTTRPIDW